MNTYPIIASDTIPCVQAAGWKVTCAPGERKAKWDELFGPYADVVLPVVLHIEMPCGEKRDYHSADEMPLDDMPCPCGNPNHWFIQYKDI